MRIYKLGIVFILMSIVSNLYAQSNDSSSSFNILFTYSDVLGYDPSFKPNRLYNISAEGETSLFYEDETAHLVRALAWSPSGNLLIVLKASADNPTKANICILTSMGVMLRCMADSATSHPLGATSYRELYLTSWSSDETSIYYVTQSEDNRRLVEADINTGNIRRIIYEYSYELPNDINNVRPMDISWNPNATFILTSVGEHLTLGDMPTLILTETQAEVPISSILGEADSSTAGYVEYICPRLSPANQLIAVIISQPNGSDKLLVLDSNLDIVAVVDDFPFHGQWKLECPFWSYDESVLYMVGTEVSTIIYNRYLIGFKGNWQRLDAVQSLPDGVHLDTIQLSPNGQYITYIASRPALQVYVLDILQQREYQITDNAGYGYYPIWQWQINGQDVSRQ